MKKHQVIKKGWRAGTKEGLQAKTSDARALVYTSTLGTYAQGCNEAKRQAATILGKPYLEMRAKRAPEADLYDYNGIPLTEGQIIEREGIQTTTGKIAVAPLNVERNKNEGTQYPKAGQVIGWALLVAVVFTLLYLFTR